MATPTIGRPSDYSDDLANQICNLMTQGASVATASSIVGISPASVYKWLGERPSFSEKYAHASRERAVARFERLDDTLAELRAGDIDANTARVIVDTIKWQCGKELPRRYGDKLELSGDAANPITIAVSYHQEQRLAQAERDHLTIDASAEPAE